MEPSAGSRIDNGCIKLFTGNDKFTTRGLYSDPKEFYCLFTPILVCNTIPKIDCEEASLNRIKIIPFESTFTVDAPESYEEQFEKKHFKIDFGLEEKLNKYKSQFIYIILKHYVETNGQPIVIPNEVDLYNQRYKNSNDFVQCWINENLIVVDNDQGEELFADVFRNYKSWLSENFEKEKSLNKNEFMNFLVQKNFKFSRNGKCILNYELSIEA